MWAFGGECTVAFLPRSVCEGGDTAGKPFSECMEVGLMMINIVTTIDMCSFTVDKNKSKAGTYQHRSQQQSAQTYQSHGIAEVERKNHEIQQLKALLAASNCRFEAMTVVLQQTLAEVRTFYYSWW